LIDEIALPEYFNVSFPLVLTFPLSVPRNGTTSSPTTSFEVDVFPVEPADDDPPDETPGEDPAAPELVLNVKTTFGLLGVPPGEGRAREEGDPVCRRRRLAEEEVLAQLDARPAEVEVGPLDADAVLEVQRVRPGGDRRHSTAERADRRPVVECDRDRVVLVEDDPELERRERNGARTGHADADDGRRGEQRNERSSNSRARTGHGTDLRLAGCADPNASRASVGLFRNNRRLRSCACRTAGSCTRPTTGT
jgi:hypothetical protein